MISFALLCFIYLYVMPAPASLLAGCTYMRVKVNVKHFHISDEWKRLEMISPKIQYVQILRLFCYLLELCI